MDKKSIFIRMLQLGAVNGAKPMTKSAFIDWAVEQGDMESKQDPVVSQLYKLFDECFICSKTPSIGEKSYVLKSEYYFRLLEFTELELSRKASSEANRNSLIATLLAVLSIIIGGYFGYVQKTTSIKIDNKQVSLMTTDKSLQIESEQLNQVIEALKQSNINTAELAKLIREQATASQLVNGEVIGK
jgi:hypothetical protein